MVITFFFENGNFKSIAESCALIMYSVKASLSYLLNHNLDRMVQ